MLRRSDRSTSFTGRGASPSAMSTTSRQKAKSAYSPTTLVHQKLHCPEERASSSAEAQAIVCSDCQMDGRLGSNQGAVKSTCRDVRGWPFCSSSREPKQLRQERLVGRAAERGPGETDVLQYVIVQLAKVAELSAPPPSSLPAFQQTQSQAEPSTGHGVPRIDPSRRLRCTHRAEYRLQCHRGNLFTLSSDRVASFSCSDSTPKPARFLLGTGAGRRCAPAGDEGEPG